MNLSDLLNIKKVDVEKVIKEAIITIKKDLSGLTYEQTCLIYSSYIYAYLKRNHIVARLINTLDLGLNYEHQIVLVPCNSETYYLIDLTFKQFDKFSVEFEQLFNCGYQIVDNTKWLNYLKILCPSFDKVLTLEDSYWTIKKDKIVR